MGYKIWIKNGTFITLRQNDVEPMQQKEFESTQDQVVKPMKDLAVQSNNDNRNVATVLTDGHMVITDDRIVYVGPDAPSEEEGPFDEIIDGRHRLYMPGLINTHGHAAMSLLRGVADDLALQVWLEQHIWPVEEKMTADDIYYGTLLSIVEMLKGGTTTFVDMYDHMDRVAEAVEQSGMRGSLMRGIIGFGEPEQVTGKLQEAARFAREWNNQADGRIKTMMAPHAPYTCPPELIQRIVDISAELDVPIHIHMSETLFEVEENRRQYRRRPVAHLQALGVFDRPCLVAHAVHLDDEEIAMLAEHDVRVAHNPVSNLKLASGIARLPEMLGAGILVGLGTDGCASNNNLDMFEEMRMASLLHKGIRGDATLIPAEQAFLMGTRHGARAIWMDDVGALQPGMKADIVSLNIDQPHFLPYSNMISHIVYSASAHDVADVWVDGRQLVKDREMLTLDEEKIKFEITARFQRLMS